MSVVPNAQSISEQISHLPGEILFSLARNDSASPDFRKAAVQLLLEKGCHQANNPELAVMVAEVKRSYDAKVEVEAIVESAIEAELPSGPFRASVTTQTMFADPIIQNASKLNEDALAEDYDVDPLVRKRINA